MSIGGIMRTSVSGMNAQATRLSTVSENIANSDTTGYKQSQTEFSSIVLASNGAGYNSGSVAAQVRTLISEQGGTNYTGNSKDPKKLDMMVSGNGFFVVGDGSGGNYLTRAGSFTQMADGSMVNAAGYKLQGYPVTADGTADVLNGYAGLEDVNLKTGLLSANATTKGTLTVPLDLNMKAQTGTHAVFKQTDVYSAAAYTAPAPGIGDKLTFTIEMDGGISVPVTVTATENTGIAGITGAQIRDAINNTVVAGTPPTTPLKNVASLDAKGYLVLTATTPALGTGSTIKIGTPVATSGAPGGAAITTVIKGLEPSGATAVTGLPVTFPSANTALLPTKDSTIKESITVYNKAGEAIKLDVYYTKIDKSTNTWEVAVFDSRKATPGTGSSPFPYGTAKSAPLASAKLDFNDDKYTLQGIEPIAGASQTDNKILNIDLGPIGGETFKLDIGNTTQFAGYTQPLAAQVDGNPAEVIKDIAVGKDGTVTASFTSGTTRALFKVPLAMVNSPDSMTALAGNVYSAGIESGTVLMGFGGSGGFGDLTSGALERSTVDLANELTTMIESQRSYTANSKVFQTGSEILDVLVNLKR